MRKTEKIIIDVEPKDIAKALVEINNIPKGFEIKSFTYSLHRIAGELLDRPEMKAFDITHCRLELEKE